ncbi:MAG: hypothetical protein WCJ17_00080 [bacterium]
MRNTVFSLPTCILFFFGCFSSFCLMYANNGYVVKNTQHSVNTVIRSIQPDMDVDVEEPSA